MLSDSCRRLDLPAGSGESFHSLLVLMRDGFSVTTLSFSARCLGISPSKVAELLGITEKKLSKNKTGQLSRQQSDHLFQMMTAFDNISRYWGGDESAQMWLHRAMLQPDGETPLSYFDTVSGIQVVSDLINRMRRGTTP